jgi:hypothetical protein
MTNEPEKFTKRDVASHPNPNCLWVRLVPYDELQSEADTLRAEVARLRLVADEMALALAEPVTTHTTDTWLQLRQNCLCAYHDAKAHGEADQ